jgi:hypothetical protein
MIFNYSKKKYPQYTPQYPDYEWYLVYMFWGISKMSKCANEQEA